MNEPNECAASTTFVRSLGATAELHLGHLLWRTYVLHLVCMGRVALTLLQFAVANAFNLPARRSAWIVPRASALQLSSAGISASLEKARSNVLAAAAASVMALPVGAKRQGAGAKSGMAQEIEARAHQLGAWTVVRASATAARRATGRQTLVGCRARHSNDCGGDEHNNSSYYSAPSTAAAAILCARRHL